MSRNSATTSLNQRFKNYADAGIRIQNS